MSSTYTQRARIILLIVGCDLLNFLIILTNFDSKNDRKDPKKMFDTAHECGGLTSHEEPVPSQHHIDPGRDAP
jgi:hypothetical protein